MECHTEFFVRIVQSEISKIAYANQISVSTLLHTFLSVKSESNKKDDQKHKSKILEVIHQSKWKLKQIITAITITHSLSLQTTGNEKTSLQLNITINNYNISEGPRVCMCPDIINALKKDGILIFCIFSIF